MYQEQFIKDSNGAIKSTQGMLVSVPWYRLNSECDEKSDRIECKAKKFAYDPKSSGKSPDPLKISWRTLTAYDATKALTTGLDTNLEQTCHKWFGKSDDSCLKQGFQVALQNNSKVKFNGDGDRNGENLGFIVQVDNGEFKIFEK
jgi:ABC-type branched-subunit amino acid transport system substrate-binding protein